MKIANSHAVIDLNVLDVAGWRQQQTNAERVRTNANVGAQRVNNELQRGLLRYDIQSLNHIQQAGRYNLHVNIHHLAIFLHKVYAH